MCIDSSNIVKKDSILDIEDRLFEIELLLETVLIAIGNQAVIENGESIEMSLDLILRMFKECLQDMKDRHRENCHP